ncbi:undecaprenyl-diphosphatase [Cypionkella psychrotolerans]|uniref:undecaprenyl-diphosphatase n=1 Tax=Cypionkella psychrotolerans TaxID=1678131 RepID=UPI0006B5E5BC|nr:undecaprenyl-diphosphatase [Cypionkella psychrotolerans]
MTLSVIEQWNQSAFLAVNAGAHAPALIISLAKVLANWSIYLAPALFVVAWVRRGRGVRFVLLDATLTALIGLGLAQVITAIWYHPRPFEIGLGRQLLDHAAEASFPSDHATLMFGLAIPLLLGTQTRRWGAVVLALGFGVAWSRIYLGVHFPLDMIGAFGVAVVAAFLVWMVGLFLRRSVYPKLISVYETMLSRFALSRTVFPRNR